MFGFGHGPELIIILVIALIVLGPGKIPEIAQMLGKGLRELRQASADLQKTFDVNELMNPAPPPPAPVPPPVETVTAPGEAAPVPAVAAIESVTPPEEPIAKPKRTRKPKIAASVEGEGGSEAAENHPSPVPPAGEGTRRRRPSKKTSEPVSLDASV